MDDAQITRRVLLAGAVAAGLSACGAKADKPPPATAAIASATTAPTLDEAILRKKIASLLIVGFRGAEVAPDDWIIRALREQGLGGVILFDRDQQSGGRRNINSPEQVTQLVRVLRGASPGRLIVSIDQEGGQIARLNPGNGFPATRSQAEIGAINDAAATREWAAGIAGSLTEIGATLNFTPDVDLASNPDNPAIARLGRAFSADPEVVVSCAREAIHAHQAAGVCTAIKHFPGFGSATGNTDFEAVDVTDTWQRTDLVPFQRLIADGTAEMVMVAHFLNRQLDPDKPASLSRAVVHDLLRGELGWTGVVVSDDMQAVAISHRYRPDEAVALALQAGVDLLTFCNQDVYDPNIVQSTVDNVVGLVRTGRLTEAQIDQSVSRVDALRPPNR